MDRGCCAKADRAGSSRTRRGVCGANQPDPVLPSERCASWAERIVIRDQAAPATLCFLRVPLAHFASFAAKFFSPKSLIALTHPPRNNDRGCHVRQFSARGPKLS